MRTHYVAFVATAGLLFVAGVSAQAAGRGGVGTPFVPHGLTSTNPGFTNGDKGNNIAPSRQPRHRSRADGLREEERRQTLGRA